jgi:hypothetical protein
VTTQTATQPDLAAARIGNDAGDMQRISKQIVNRLWFLHVGRIDDIWLEPASERYVVQFSHTVNYEARQRITNDGFEIVDTKCRPGNDLGNPYRLKLKPPARWQTTPAPQPVTDAPAFAVEAELPSVLDSLTELAYEWLGAQREMAEARIEIKYLKNVNGALTDRITGLTLRAELAERKLAALESERTITTQPVVELPNTELKKWDGERVVITRLLPPRSYNGGGKHDRSTAVFDADGVEGWAAVFPEVVDMLVKEHGYTSSRIRKANATADKDGKLGLKFDPALTGILKWDDTVGLKLVAFDKPEEVQNVA